MSQRSSGQSASRGGTAFQRLQAQLKYIDVIFEVLDARLPGSSRHPGSAEIFGNKPRLLVLTKEDLADVRKVEQWLQSLNEASESVRAISLSLKGLRNKERIFQIALELTAEKRKQQANKGLLPRPMRACVVGMPNVGKSSLINWLVGQKRAKVGNKPGVTRGPQWVRVHPQIELLDTPGVLPATSFTPETSTKLALANLLPESNYDLQEIASSGINILSEQYPQLMQAYIPDLQPDSLSLEELAARKHFLTSGGKPDANRAARKFLSDLRDGNLGRITLEMPTPHL